MNTKPPLITSLPLGFNPILVPLLGWRSSAEHEFYARVFDLGFCVEVKLWPLSWEHWYNFTGKVVLQFFSVSTKVLDEKKNRTEEEVKKKEMKKSFWFV